LLLVQEPLRLVDRDVRVGLRIYYETDNLVSLDAAALVDHVDRDLVADRGGLGAAARERAGQVVDRADLDIVAGEGRAAGKCGGDGESQFRDGTLHQVLPEIRCFLGSSVRSAVRACQWRDDAAACCCFAQRGGYAMTNVFAAGGYRTIPAVFQYSGGVAAEPGFEIVRVRFGNPVPLSDGFACAESMMRGAGRLRTAFGASELRSPARSTEEAFRAFNEIYAGTLRRWCVMQGNATPVARSN